MSNQFSLTLLISAVLCCNGCATLPAAISDAPTKNAQAVVFDIDGTLTPTPNITSSIIKPKPRPDAAKAAQAFADKGYKVFYLSARKPILARYTAHWLKTNKFPDGSVHVEERNSTDDMKADAFKIKMLHEFTAHGWKLEYAYGDSSTDFSAYAAAGIPKAHVFALQRSDENKCQEGEWTTCLIGWAEHMSTINSIPMANSK